MSEQGAFSSKTTPGAPISDEAAVVVADPRWVPENFFYQDDTIQFAWLERDRIASETFYGGYLDTHPEVPRKRIRLDALVAAMGPLKAPVPLHFIWHTAWCCSTAVTRDIDMPGKSLALREPAIISRLSSIKRARQYGPAATAALELSLRLLGRPHVPGEQVTIKPSSIVSNLISDCARLTTGQMLFLHTDCRDFLLSVADKGESRRGHVRRLFAEFARDHAEIGRWAANKLFFMTDLSIASLVWQMTMEEMARNMAALDPKRAASLEAAVFLADPETAITKLDGFFGLHLGKERIAEMTVGKNAGRDAKRPNEQFDVALRGAGRREVDPKVEADLTTVVAWCRDVCKSPEAPRLTNPLVT